MPCFKDSNYSLCIINRIIGQTKLKINFATTIEAKLQFKLPKHQYIKKIGTLYFTKSPVEAPKINWRQTPSPIKHLHAREGFSYDNFSQLKREIKFCTEVSTRKTPLEHRTHKKHNHMDGHLQSSTQHPPMHRPTCMHA